MFDLDTQLKLVIVLSLVKSCCNSKVFSGIVTLITVSPKIYHNIIFESCSKGKI